MEAQREPVIVTITADKHGITVSPTAVEVCVGQHVEWRAHGFQALRLVFYEGNPINNPVLDGVDSAHGFAANIGIFHYQVILAKGEALEAGKGVGVKLFADTGCPTIIIR